MKKFILYTDGGARGNPGPAAAGAVIYDATDQRVGEFSLFLGVTTNNQAEYQAMILGLGHIQKIIGDEHIAKEVDVDMYSDSELIIKQLKGEYRVKNKALKPMFVKLQELISKFNQVNFQHIPRYNNKEADRLVNIELDKHI